MYQGAQLSIHDPCNLFYDIVHIVIPAQLGLQSEAVFKIGCSYAETIAFNRAFLQVGSDRDDVAFHSHKQLDLQPGLTLKGDPFALEAGQLERHWKLLLMLV